MFMNLDIWDPSFCELLDIPIPEDVVSIALENLSPYTTQGQASGMQTYTFLLVLFSVLIYVTVPAF